MLTEELLQKAKAKFDGQEVYKQFIDLMWPFIRDFDFSNKNHLVMDRPKRTAVVFDTSTKTSRTIMVPYSNRLIRQVLGEFGLTATYLSDKEMLRIKAIPPNQRKA